MCHRSNTLVGAVPGAMPCHDSLDCARKNLVGYTCQNLRCVCDPTTDTGLFSCRGRMFGAECRSDYECADELNLVCSRNELGRCRCRGGYTWNSIKNNCYMINEFEYEGGNTVVIGRYALTLNLRVHYMRQQSSLHAYDRRTKFYRHRCNISNNISATNLSVIQGSGGFGSPQDVFSVCLVVLLTVGFIYVGMKGFWCCGKFWKRQQRRLTRELDEIPHQQQDIWVAPYRVLSSLNGMETHSSLGLSPSSSFPLHPIPCVGLFLPSGSLAAAAAASTMAPTMSPPPYEEAVSPPPYEEALAPPPYEEALKHNIILSSFPSATTVILPTAPPIQGPPNTMPGGAFMCNSQGGLT
ncbi:hypothetical protein Cfor_01942 [Coptotermes formosanus]|uniref:EB domain-containing protein n=1 Tax=Coptotermes formosanus TaxID=36987 RepID=A0A6L2PPW0_COPFO|nr:hypothetical protein Cfor_01942 [Coptotermes formosanus]